jgi:hypothetical protein
MAKVGVHDDDDIAAGSASSRYYGLRYTPITVSGEEAHRMRLPPLQDALARAVGGAIVHYHHFKLVRKLIDKRYYARKKSIDIPSFVYGRNDDRNLRHDFLSPVYKNYTYGIITILWTFSVPT